jgi:hypothetical protein
VCRVGKGSNRDRITHQSPRQQGYGSTSSHRNDSLKHKRKHERKKRGIEPKNKAARLWRTVRRGGADCPHGPRELSVLLPRTVRTRTADRLALSRGLSVKANRTSSSKPRKTDRPQGERGPSARNPRTVCTSAADRPKLRPTKTQNQNGSKAKPSKNTKNTRRTLLSRTVRHLLEDCPRLMDRGKNCSTPNVNSPNSSPDLPNGRSC